MDLTFELEDALTLYVFEHPEEGNRLDLFFSYYFLHPERFAQVEEMEGATVNSVIYLAMMVDSLEKFNQWCVGEGYYPEENSRGITRLVDYYLDLIDEVYVRFESMEEQGS